MSTSFNTAIHKRPQQGIVLMHGNEAVLRYALLDAFRADWTAQAIERQRIDLQHVSDWETIIASLSQPSLFASQTAIEVHAAIKPDATQLEKIKRWAEQNTGQDTLLMVCDQVEKKALSQPWYQCIAHYGHIIDCWFNQPREAALFLKDYAQQCHVQCDDEAWDYLLMHTENNLQAAYQCITKLSYTHTNTPVDTAHLQHVLFDESRYTPYDLSHALLQGNLSQTLHILNFLRDADVAPSTVLWPLAKDTRALLAAVLNRTHFSQNAQTYGVWNNKTSLYLQASQRIAPSSVGKLPQLIKTVDAQIKGAELGSPWVTLQHIVQLLCSSKH